MDIDATDAATIATALHLAIDMAIGVKLQQMQTMVAAQMLTEDEARGDFRQWFDAHRKTVASFPSLVYLVEKQRERALGNFEMILELTRET